MGWGDLSKGTLDAQPRVCHLCKPEMGDGVRGKEGMASEKAAARAGVNDSSSVEVNRPGAFSP